LRGDNKPPLAAFSKSFCKDSITKINNIGDLPLAPFKSTAIELVDNKIEIQLLHLPQNQTVARPLAKNPTYNIESLSNIELQEYPDFFALCRFLMRFCASALDEGTLST
jgi:hypothetical protein